MNSSLGKNFERKFYENFLNSIPNSICIRQYDTTSGYLNINTFCDFICFDGTKMYMLDCKTHKGNSFPFTAFPQLERLDSLRNVPNLVTGIILWLYEKDRVIFIPTQTVKKLIKNNIKSFNIDKIDKDKYYYLNIPSVKLKAFMNSDYSVLKDIKTEDIEKWKNQ